MNRKEFLKLSFKTGLGAAGAGLAGGLGYSYFGNSEYKQTFPHIEENHVSLPKNGKTVCILGAGLAGLQAACELSDRGFTVVLLEKTSLPGGKLKTWKDRHFAKQHFGNKAYSREHGLHAIWGFYKNLREFLGRHKIEITPLSSNDSFYYFISSRGVQNKIRTTTWPVPFDRLEMINNGVYIPSREDINVPASNLFETFAVSLKMWGFDFSNKQDRLYLDSISFYDWAVKNGISIEYIKHFYEALSEMGFFMTTKECSALAVVNFIRLGNLPQDSRVDFYKWPPDETFINPMVKHIEKNGGKIYYNQEISGILKENGKVAGVETNRAYPAGRFRRCRICGNIMGEGEYEHCPFCGAHHSELELVSGIKPEVFKADYFICAMDVPGARRFVSTAGLDKENIYFQNITKLTNAHILCVNLLYENSTAWDERFKGEWSSVDFMPTGYETLGFTTNWSAKQIPGLKEKKIDLIEVQVSKWKELLKFTHSEIAEKVHEELKLILPKLGNFSEYYINRWDTYTGYRIGDEANRPEIQSPIENLLFIGDWVFTNQHSVFMERTNVMAKTVTNLMLKKIGSKQGYIKILNSGTPDWPTALLKYVTSVK